MRITTLAGGAVATALLLSGASLAFAQTTGTATASYNPSAQVVPATPNTGTAAAATTGTGSVVPTSSSAGTSTATPGVPNTGAGGDMAQNVAVLGASAAVALFGAAYLMRRRYAI